MMRVGNAAFRPFYKICRDTRLLSSYTSPHLICSVSPVATNIRNVSFHHGITVYLSMHLSMLKRTYCSEPVRNLSEAQYHSVADLTLDSLTERFEDLGDSSITDEDYDVVLGQGVLTVKLGGDKGTYVINKQGPNKQIWLSSPKSGPKRYDFNGKEWIYKHESFTLHDLLTKEISETYNTEVNFKDCEFSDGRS